MKPLNEYSHLRSNIIGGCISGLIYFIVDIATGGNVAAALGGGVLLAVAVSAFAFTVSRTVVASKRRASRGSGAS